MNGSIEQAPTQTNVSRSPHRRIVVLVGIVLLAAILAVALAAPASANPGSQPLLSGQVTDSTTMMPLAGVHVQVLTGTTVVAQAWTNFAGNYWVHAPAGTYTVTFSRYPYQMVTDTAVVVSGPTTTLNASLTTLPMLTGHVTDSATMKPLAGVKVQVMTGTTVVAWAKTNFMGNYSLSVAAGN